MLKRVHHINFLVADLDKSIERYKDLFELESVEIEMLPERGVATARFDLDGVWIVLVQPVDDKSEPARILREQGEGVFLISFAVDDLDDAREKLVAKGAISRSATTRDGLLNWRVIDLDPEAVFGAPVQLTEEV
ncbi:MAG: VOC family protein [Proteobacteria bacterium]|nr:VOC family protein [Pseudomonadota bacterium]